MKTLNLSTRKQDNLIRKIFNLNWSFLLMVTVISCIGFLSLYSAGGGNIKPWMDKQVIRFGVGMGALILIAITDIKYWLRYAYILYAISFVALIIVEGMGQIGGGAQRWINLGIFHLQPSELMKITLILALARYFHLHTEKELSKISYFIFPVMLILAPAGLVLVQPDLGTALILIMIGGIILFIAGLPNWIVLISGGTVLSGLPVLWFFLRDYQKQRVLTFLNPERDPLGSGYHIIQSKIALGSGGVFGKGFLNGSQSYLNYLPEKQTDFIFTMFAEEFGMVGGSVLIILYGILIYMGYSIAIRARHQFGRLVCLGIISTVFLYAFINMAMVMGLLPVVGVPLPLMSYGGTSMVTLLLGFGFLLSVDVHPHTQLHRPSRFEM